MLDPSDLQKTIKISMMTLSDGNYGEMKILIHCWWESIIDWFKIFGKQFSNISVNVKCVCISHELPVYTCEEVPSMYAGSMDRNIFHYFLY